MVAMAYRQKNNYIYIYIYYINSSEIPSELSRENFVSSHVKITCYLPAWRDHCRYGYIINRTFENKLIWYFTGVYIINKILHTRLSIWILSLSWTLEDKIHIHKWVCNTRACNIPYIYVIHWPIGPYWEKLCPRSRVLPKAAGGILDCLISTIIISCIPKMVALTRVKQSFHAKGSGYEVKVWILRH